MTEFKRTDPHGELWKAPYSLWNRDTRELKGDIDPVMREIAERTEKPVWDPDLSTWFSMRCWLALLNAFFERLDVRGKCHGNQADNLMPDGECYIELMREVYHGNVMQQLPSSIWGQARITSALHAMPIMSCAFGVPMEQSEVLALYPRAVQKKLLATWQFNLPAVHNFGSPKKRYTVGFHPEVEHPRWQKERSTFTSLGVSKGMGAIILPNTEPGANTWYSGEEPHLILSKVFNKQLSYS